MADMPQDYSLAHVLVGEPVPTPDQVRGRLSPGHARGSHSMAYLDLPAAALAWLGRQGTRAVAVSLFAGLALPPLAASMKAIFTPNLFVLLCLAFLRVDPDALRRHFTRPGLVVAAVAWMMLATPLAAGLALAPLGLDQSAPGLLVALIFQAAAPPVIATPAFAALIGLDAALALATLVACAAVTPLTAALFAALFLGPPVPISAPAPGAVRGGFSRAAGGDFGARARRAIARPARRRRPRGRAGAPDRRAGVGRAT